MKRKPPTLPQLKKKAWALLSKAIRLEARDSETLLVQCVTCHYKNVWNLGIQAGHFIDGRFNSILFDERGIHPQCYACNVLLNGRKDEYFIFMEQKYGRKVVDDLMIQKRVIKSFTREELLGLASYYKDRIEIEVASRGAF